MRVCRRTQHSHDEQQVKEVNMGEILGLGCNPLTATAVGIGPTPPRASNI